MTNFYWRALKFSSDRLKRRDIFKESISLTYRGQNHIKTFLGGVCTIFIFLITAVWGIFLFSSYIQRRDISWNQNFYFLDMANETNFITLTDEDDIQIKLTLTYSGEIDIKGNFEKYLDLQAINRKAIPTDGEITLLNEDSLVKRGKWGPLFFSHIDKWKNSSSLGVYTYSKSMCFTLSGLSLGGSKNNLDGHQYIRIGMSQWDPLFSDWDEYSKMKEVLEGTFVSYSIKSNYVNLNEIENPIENRVESGEF